MAIIRKAKTTLGERAIAGVIASVIASLAAVVGFAAGVAASGLIIKDRDGESGLLTAPVGALVFGIIAWIVAYRWFSSYGESPTDGD